MMRDIFFFIFILLALALTVCTVLSLRSKKTIGPSVARLLIALIPPVIGNSIIVASVNRTFSVIGCYIYFLGMDLVVISLLRFAFDYCLIRWPNRFLKYAVYALLLADVLQYVLNPFFGQAFGIETILVENQPYHRLIPYAGQTFHRAVDYGIFLAVLIIFLVKAVRTPRVYSERYSVIFFSMIVCGLWQTFYIVSRTPVDQSMIGFGVFGLLVFYFALVYRPVRLLDRMLANIASGMPEALFFFDLAGRCIWANRPGIDFAGIAGENFEAVGARLRELFGSSAGTGSWSGRRTLTLGGRTGYYIAEYHEVADEKGRAVGSFLSVRDNTADELALQKEQYAVRHDRLTDLYTKDYLYERTRRQIEEQADEKQLILFLDVSDFKIVNDIFGNDFGDIALRAIADWIRKEWSACGIFGRLGGDTFGVCLPAGLFDEAHIEQALSEFTVREGNVEHPILLHLGVYEVTEPELDVSVMYDRAHLALSTIKNVYKSHIAWYDDKMRMKVLWNQHITAQLPDAMAQRQVRPYLQAMVDNSGRIVGAEALVRWIHPEDGFLSPGLFIPVFEQNGMIAELDKYMWRCACEILSRWEREGNDLFLSVNISPKDFYFIDVAAELKSIVREFGINPARLRVEITENVMMTDIEKRIRIIDELKSAGFLVEMDDFGSGYSSLNMLKDMPVDVIKIDMMFLKRSSDDIKAQKILQSVLKLSEELGLGSVTEGVETLTQYQMLSAMGCKLFQGFYFDRPMPVEDFERKYLDDRDTLQAVKNVSGN